jgi:hypothetical protein
MKLPTGERHYRWITATALGRAAMADTMTHTKKMRSSSWRQSRDHQHMGIGWYDVMGQSAVVFNLSQQVMN